MHDLAPAPERTTRATALALTLALASSVGLLPPKSHAAPEPVHFIAPLGEGVSKLTTTGYSIGYDIRPTPWNIGAWLGRPDGSRLQLGFRDALHTGTDGRRGTGASDVNNGGVSIGSSNRYLGNEYHGESAWVCDRHGNLVKIGFYDAAHTFDDGRKLSRAYAVNERNQAIGFSVRSGGYDTQSAWLATSTGRIRRIGLCDPAHTSPQGWQFSYPTALNNAGYVIGFSQRYAPGGRTTWLYQPWGALRIVGLQSGIHRAADGRYDNEIKFLTQSGYIAGDATRYQPATNQINGTTAWVTHVDGPNRPVGLYDSRHLAPTGFAESVVTDINEHGTSIGTSSVVAEGDPGMWGASGRSAWIARPDGTTTRIGLYDAAHTWTESGLNWQSVFGLNENDIAIGEAAYFNPTTGGPFQGVSPYGISAWVADLATGVTARIGLVDAAHTRADGFRVSSPQGLTASRFVIGLSYRYGDARPDGSVPFTTWLYDRTTHRHIVLNALPGTPPGFATGTVLLNYADDAGTIIGSYNLHQWGVASRAFIYDPCAGFRHLDEVVDVDIADHGFSRFSEPQFVTPSGYIAGVGVLSENELTGRRMYFLSW